MDKINRCARQRRGIKIIEPNENLSKAYLLKAEEALESMRLNKVKDWKISTSYYSLYFSIYSLRARIQSQYYVDCEVQDDQYEKMMKETPLFLVKCKNVLIGLNENKVNKIRENLRKVID